MARSSVTLTLTAAGIDALRIAARALREIADADREAGDVALAEHALQLIEDRLDGEPIVRRF